MIRIAIVDDKKVIREQIKKLIERKRQANGQLYVKTRNRNATFNQSDILYIESRAKKVEMRYLKNGGGIFV